MASGSSPHRQHGEQSPRRPMTAFECLELLCSEGSDYEEEEEEEEGSLWSDGSSELSESESEVPDAPLPRRLRRTNQPSQPAGLQDLDADEILDFFMQDWNEDFSFFPAVSPFCGSTGLHLSKECHTPLDFFEEIFDNSLLDHIVDETNKYAQQNLAAKGDLSSRSIFRQWKDEGISRNELIGFLAICVHMALVHKPELKDYWSLNPILVAPFAANIMTRDKFHLLLAMLHVSDNEEFVPAGQPGHDPLQKIRPVYTHLQEKFRCLYTPGENVCVDEAMCAWRGRSRFKVFIKDMPVKWRLKLYELCESHSGYCYNFEIFAAEPGVSNRPVDVVMRLSDSLLGAGRSIYVDNYYCCPELGDKLVGKNTHCVGTVRANRKGMPPQFKTLPMPARGEVQAFRQGGVTVLRWKDKRPVHLLNTKTDPREMKDVKTQRGTRVRKPAAVQDYVLNMSGVDRSDQLLSYMPLKRKTLKWWKKVFFHLFTLSVVQACILYNIQQRERHHRKMPLKNFFVSLGNALSEKFQQGSAATAPPSPLPGPSTSAPTPAAGASSIQSPQTRLSGKDHFSHPLPLSRGGRKTFRMCHVCTARSKRHSDTRPRKTQNWCQKCGIPLCDKLCQGKNVTCFQLYHTVKDYAG